jgi:nicotinate-nucleotide adenylyltransferase
LSPLAILGGTFDPVHFGHLRLAADVRNALALDDVRLVPSGDPPHRDAPRASAADRVAMLQLAVAAFPGLAVDTREIARGGKSFTVDTLADLRAEMPARPLALLVGADAFQGFPAWHRWRTLFDLAHIVVVPRPGVALERGLSDDLAAEWRARRIDDPQGLRDRPAGTIYVQPVTAQPISSSFIRAKLAAGASSVELAGLLPASVLAYIESNQLYRHVPHAD